VGWLCGQSLGFGGQNGDVSWVDQMGKVLLESNNVLFELSSLVSFNPTAKQVSTIPDLYANLSKKDMLVDRRCVQEVPWIRKG